MSQQEYGEELDNAAHYALVKAKAIKVCRAHPDVQIRVGDHEAEKNAYAIATNDLKKDGTMWKREDMMKAVKRVLDNAADEQCPQCASIRDD